VIFSPIFLFSENKLKQLLQYSYAYTTQEQEEIIITKYTGPVMYLRERSSKIE
jgi:hypothetical protein